MLYFRWPHIRYKYNLSDVIPHIRQAAVVCQRKSSLEAVQGQIVLAGVEAAKTLV
jgi:hypothetical protein